VANATLTNSYDGVDGPFQGWCEGGRTLRDYGIMTNRRVGRVAHCGLLTSLGELARGNMLAELDGVYDECQGRASDAEGSTRRMGEAEGRRKRDVGGRGKDG